jgi:hypothetical protein
MVTKFQIPVNEGPVPIKPAEFRKFEQGELPIKIGNIERKDFSYLGDWYQMMRPDGYGIAYRIGIKEGIIDQEGDLGDLLIIFGTPVAKHGLEISNDLVSVLYKQLGSVMQTAVMRASNSHDNLLATLMPPPDYMIKELQEKLSH